MYNTRSLFQILRLEGVQGRRQELNSEAATWAYICPTIPEVVLVTYVFSIQTRSGARLGNDNECIYRKMKAARLTIDQIRSQMLETIRRPISPTVRATKTDERERETNDNDILHARHSFGGKSEMPDVCGVPRRFRLPRGVTELTIIQSVPSSTRPWLDRAVSA